MSRQAVQIDAPTRGGKRQRQKQAEILLAEVKPEEEDCGPGLRWESVDSWERATTLELMAIGADLLADDAALAVQCYTRAYNIAKQPAPRPKDPFAPDPEPERRRQWWPTEVQCRSAICVSEARITVALDPALSAAGTIAKLASELARLRSIAEEVAAACKRQGAHSWLLFNISVRIYGLVQDVLSRGLAGPSLTLLLPPLVWVVGAVDSCALLARTARYAEWRVQLCALACRCFEAIGKPSAAAKFCARLMERLVAATEGSDDAERLGEATQLLKVIAIRYTACLTPEAVNSAMLDDFSDDATKLGAINEALTGLATASDAMGEEEVPPTNGDEAVAPAAPPLIESYVIARRRTLQHLPVPEVGVAALEAVISSGVAILAKDEGDDAGSAWGIGQPSLEAHVAFIKWCFSYERSAEFAQVVGGGISRLALEGDEGYAILRAELALLQQLATPRPSALPPVELADKLYELAQAQTASAAASVSDLLYDGALLLWDAIKSMTFKSEQQAEDGADPDEVLATGFEGGPLVRCLFVVMHCLKACDADDALLRASVSLRLADTWDKAGEAALALEVAQQGIADVEASRSYYVEGRDVAYSLSASRVDGEDALYQRLCAVHVELVNCKFRLQLSAGLATARAAAERKHEAMLATLRNRQGQQPMYGMRTEKQAQAESLALSRPPPRLAFCEKTEKRLLASCGHNVYLQALLYCQMARFREAAADVAPLLTEAAELLIQAGRTEDLLSRHWSETVADAGRRREEAGNTKRPRTPILLSRTHTTVTLFPPPLYLNKTPRSWALFGKVAGAGTGCALTNTELAGTGEKSSADALAPISVTGLEPNQSYVFAVAAYGSSGKVIGSIGETCVPVPCLHPLPVQACQGYLAVLAAELGCLRICNIALVPLRKALCEPDGRSVVEGMQEPGRAMCKLPGTVLNKSLAATLSAPTLRSFAQALLLSVFVPGTGNKPYAALKPPKNKEARELLGYGPQKPQLTVLKDVRTLLVALEVACSIADDTLKMQLCTGLYAVMAPLLDVRAKPMYLLPALIRAYGALATVAPEKLCADGADEAGNVASEARVVVSCISYQLLTLMQQLDAAPAARLVVEEVVAMVRATSTACDDVRRSGAATALETAKFGGDIATLAKALRVAKRSGVDERKVAEAEAKLEELKMAHAEAIAAAKAKRAAMKAEHAMAKAAYFEAKAAAAELSSEFEQDAAFEAEGEANSDEEKEDEDEEEEEQDMGAEDAEADAAERTDPWSGLAQWSAFIQTVLSMPADVSGDLATVASAATPGADGSALAEMWTKLRDAGVGPAVEDAKALAGDTTAEFMRHAAQLCKSALEQKKVTECREVSELVIADATAMEKDVVYVAPDVQIEEMTPEGEVPEPVDLDALDEEARAAAVEEMHAAEEAAREAKEARAAEYIQGSIRNLKSLRATKSEARAKIIAEMPWRSFLECVCAEARFILWRDTGADSGLVVSEPEPGVEVEAQAPVDEEASEPPEWKLILKQIVRAAVFAGRSKSWVQMDNACLLFFNIATWLQSNLPAAAEVDACISPLARELAKYSVEMLMALKDECDSAKADAAAERSDAGLEIAATVASSQDHWFAEVAVPEVSAVAKFVIWSLRICLRRNLFGAVAETAVRLNYITDDVYGEQVLPMIVKAKRALGEDTSQAEQRQAVILRDKSMALEVFDSTRGVLRGFITAADEERPDVDRDPTRVVSAFESTISLLREKRETLLLCQALNELGDFHFRFGRPIEASVAWSDGVDAACGVYASVKEWRDILQGLDGEEVEDAKILDRIGIWEACMAVTMLGKLAKFVHKRDAQSRLECSLYAARMVHIMHCSDLGHPHKLREFARFRLKQLWANVDLFGAPEVCSAAVLAEVLEFVACELATRKQLLPSLPVLSLYEHVAISLRSTFHFMQCALIRAKVLGRAGYLKEATQSLADVGNGGAPGMEGIVGAEGGSLLHNELPPQHADNAAAIEHVCGLTLPIFPESCLAPERRDYLECHLILTTEELRVRLALSALEEYGEAATTCRTGLLAGAEARLQTLVKARVGTTVEPPPPPDGDEPGTVQTIFSALDTQAKCLALLLLARISEARLQPTETLSTVVLAMDLVRGATQLPLSPAAEGLELEMAQRCFVGVDVWLQCRALAADAQIGCRRFKAAKAECEAMVADAEATNDVMWSCGAQLRLALVAAYEGAIRQARKGLEAVIKRMAKAHLQDLMYVEALCRLADLHDKLGKPKAASERLWEAESVISAGIAPRYGLMQGAVLSSDCAPASLEDLPLRHSLYLPPALPLARIHAALGGIAAAGGDVVAAGAHLSAAAFIATTNVAMAPSEFLCSLSLALGRHSRLHYEQQSGEAYFGGSFTAAPTEEELVAAAESEAEVAAVAAHPDEGFDRARRQLLRSIELGVGGASHRHSVLRAALLELAVLHAQQPSVPAKRSSLAYLRHAATVRAMEARLEQLQSSIPLASNALGSPPPPFVAVDLIASRERDESEAPSVTDVVQYYCSARAELDYAAVGAAALEERMSKLHAYVRAACVGLSAEVFLPVGWVPPVEANGEEGHVVVQWYMTGREISSSGILEGEGGSGEEAEQPKRKSLGERLGLPGAVPLAEAADAMPSGGGIGTQISALVGVGPLEEAGEAVVGKIVTSRAEAARLHRCLRELRFTMAERAEIGTAAAEEPQGEEPSAEQAATAKVLESFFAEVVGDLALLLLPAHTELGVLPPLALSVEVVAVLETLMDTSFGGSEVDGSVAAWLRAVLSAHSAGHLAER